MPPPSMPYTRHSTLPPNFPSGPQVGGSPFQRSITPSYVGQTQMLHIPFGTPYDMGRRHRSATPYAPTTSSNLAYAQPVIAPPVDLMGAYPTPISANDGNTGNYNLDIIPMEMLEAHGDSSNAPTPIPMQQPQQQVGMGMDLSMEQQMQMQMQMPMEMQTQMQDYGGMQYEPDQGRGGGTMGWGWRSYEPGNFIPTEQQIGEVPAEYREQV